MRPDRHILRELKRIDPLVTVRWCEEIGRWGVFHELPMHERVGPAIEKRAAELQAELWKRGYLVTKRVCEEYAAKQVKDRELVFYVAEEDGAYRPLDMRVVEKMRRMDWFRRNWDFKDWRSFMDAKANLARDARDRAWEDYIAQVKKDRVYNQQVKDILQGDAHTRSVNVTQEDKTPRYPIAEVSKEKADAAH